MEITFFAFPVLLAGLLSSGDSILRALMVCLLFGSTATLSISALGDAPILPAVLLMPFLVWRAVADKSISLSPRLLLHPEPGFWLLLLVVWEVIGAFALPRLFEGETMVFSTNRGVTSTVVLMPLKPLSTNITQSVYAILGLVCFLSVLTLLDSERRMAKVRDAVLLLAAINIGAALLQLAENYLGFPRILDLFRNASYGTFRSGEVGGLLRIYGTFPETSAFSAFTLALFAFAASLCRDGERPLYSGAIALASLLLLVITTSSTAYAGLLGYGVIATLIAWSQAYWHRLPLKLGPTILMLWVLAVLACFVLLLKPQVFVRVFEFFDLTLVNKLDTASGRERSMWTRQGWINVMDTYGLGIGYGSGRTSSLPMALLSNIGIIGAGLFLAFLSHLLPKAVAGLPPVTTAVSKAARHGLLISLIAGAVSGTMADPGMVFYVLAAIAAAGIVPKVSRAEYIPAQMGFRTTDGGSRPALLD